MNYLACPWTNDGACKSLCQFYERTDSSCVIASFMRSNIKKESAKRKAPSKFIPPTVDEVREYIKLKNYSGFTAENFVGYYESKGWKIGSSTMKNWKAACDNWERRRKESVSGPILDFGEYGSGL